MGVLANHVPSIEQLKPGLIEIIEESGGSKQFFRMLPIAELYVPFFFDCTQGHTERLFIA